VLQFGKKGYILSVADADLKIIKVSDETLTTEDHAGKNLEDVFIKY
jgi:hypothetical protein